MQTPLARRAGPWKRVWAVGASGALAVWLGAVVATVLGFGLAWAVITFTHMLKK